MRYSIVTVADELPESRECESDATTLLFRIYESRERFDYSSLSSEGSGA